MRIFSEYDIKIGHSQPKIIPLSSKYKCEIPARSVQKVELNLRENYSVPHDAKIFVNDFGNKNRETAIGIYDTSRPIKICFSFKYI